MEPSWNELLELRRVTELTGNIHELQVLQLKMWPIVAAPHAHSYGAEIDTEKKVVVFTWTRKPGTKPPKDFASRLKSLAESCKSLFGLQWHVIIKQNGRIIHDAPRQRKREDALTKATKQYASETSGGNVGTRKKTSRGKTPAKRTRKTGV